MRTRRPTGSALLDALEAGEVRVAERDTEGVWVVHAWVKEEILALFRRSPVTAHGAPGESPLGDFVDKEAFPVRRFRAADGVRIVPGGTSIRRGAFLGRGVICMPPSYVNVGAHVGEDTLVDSHALVGSCAQVGARVHLSAAAQIGGVLEPVGARPVIVEDDVFVGGGSGLFEGVLVRRAAVLAAGVVLTGRGTIHDLVHGRELRGDAAHPLEVPPRAVVVPGSRPAKGDWARERGLQVACALLVKYRDERTDRATVLEDALRDVR